MLKKSGICLTLGLFACSPLISALVASCILDYSEITPHLLSGSPNDSFGQYVRELGKGTSGIVSLYNSNVSSEPLVLKSFPHETSSQNETVCRDDKRQTREVKLEFYIGRLLNGINGVVQTYELLYDQFTCTWHIATQYVPNSLAQLRKTLSVEDLVTTLLKLTETLRAIHHHGISHGDIKLENVLLLTNPNLEPMLIDFGTATFSHCPIEAPINHNGEILTNVIPGDYGTLPYMAPEVVLSPGKDYDRAKADIWSLGVLSYIVFNGRTPWKRASVEDSGWRSFMGWDEDPSCRYAPEMVLQYPTCSRGKARFLESIPVAIRQGVGVWLEVDPMYRGYEI